jgi:VanZ family protein
MTLFLRLTAWLLAAAVTFATLGPPRYRPEAAAITHAGEHALAFVLVGLAFSLAYPRARVWVVGLSVILTGLLELLQLFVPGRHARLEDFVVGTLAAVAGISLVAILDRVAPSQWRAKAP